MRKMAILFWLVLPIVAMAYHKGPGQKRLQWDEAADLIQAAEQHAAAEQWVDAVQNYEKALLLLDDSRRHLAWNVRLERARCQMFAKQLPLAHQDLQILAEEVQADPSASGELLARTRDALANSRYYMTWLMRLEGEPKSVWEPEIEAARQTYRLLAEESMSAGQVNNTKRYREDLEATIRLARMDLSDLQGLPIPNQ